MPNWIESLLLKVLLKQVNDLPFIGAMARVYTANGSLVEMLGLVATLSSGKTDDKVAQAVALAHTPLRTQLPDTWRKRIDALAKQLGAQP